MTFYIKPPDGSTNYRHLESYCRKRLSFLVDISRCHGDLPSLLDVVRKLSTVEDCECLIENSRKDAISHFTLRLLSSGDDDFAEFFISAETALFAFRFSCMNETELRRTIRPISKLHRYVPQLPDQLAELYTVIQAVTEKRSWRESLCLYLSGSDEIAARISFQLVTDLVASRSVVMQAGLALVPCSRLCDLLTEQFRKHLQYGISLAKERIATALQDPRIQNLFDLMKTSFNSLHHDITSLGGAFIRSSDVDMLSDRFPLCMVHVHRELRRKHRLRHFSRLQLMLFLKEIGVPVHEAIQFWSKEYSQPELCMPGDRQRHHWVKENKRYTYSIRHMYGLEGARRNYRGQCCTSLQEHSWTMMEEGGCPLKHFDDPSLRDLLHSRDISPEVCANILKIRTSGNIQAVCHTYLQTKIRQQQHQFMVLKKQTDLGEGAGVKEIGHYDLLGMEMVIGVGTLSGCCEFNCTSCVDMPLTPRCADKRLVVGEHSKVGNVAVHKARISSSQSKKYMPPSELSIKRHKLDSSPSDCETVQCKDSITEAACCSRLPSVSKEGEIITMTHIDKPVDFYISYSKLLHELRIN